MKSQKAKSSKLAAIPVCKNELYTAQIDAWSSDGAGTAHIAGYAIFIPGTIPGERWVIRIVKVTATAIFGKAETLLDASERRCQPACPLFKRCGGCTLQHMEYTKKLDFKLEKVNRTFSHVGHLPLEIDHIYGAEQITSYRNKAIYAFGPGPVVGFFRERTHDVCAIRRCLLHPPLADQAALTVCRVMKAYRIAPYQEHSRTGVLRHVVTRIGTRTGQVLVMIVATGKLGPATQAVIQALQEEIPGLVGVLLCKNRSPGNTVLAGSFYTLWGTDRLEDSLCGVRVTLSPQSFYQINHAQTERLYSMVAEMACPTPASVILDLYCGVGTITLYLARMAKHCLGVEIVPEAVENAQYNAQINGIDNAQFLCLDAGSLTPDTPALAALHPDIVVVDPPRKGLDAQVCACICALAPARIVYVSCNVATQARDLARMAAHGYVARRAEAFDLFPRTSHVETVVLLTPDGDPVAD